MTYFKTFHVCHYYVTQIERRLKAWKKCICWNSNHIQRLSAQLSKKKTLLVNKSSKAAVEEHKNTQIGHEQRNTTEHNSFTRSENLLHITSKLVTPECWNLKGLQIIQIQKENHRNSYRGQGHQSTRNWISIHQFQTQFFHFLLSTLVAHLQGQSFIYIQDAPMHFVIQAIQARKGCISHSDGNNKLIWLFLNCVFRNMIYFL